MKKLLSILALTMIVACSTPASANDVADDGKCLDDIKHFNHLWKTTSASDEDKASAKANEMKDLHIGLRVTKKSVRQHIRPLGH